MADLWATTLGLMVVLFLIRPFQTDAATIFKIVVIMGLVSHALRIISVDMITGWASAAGTAVNATAIGGSLVLVGLNFAIQQTDVPFLPDNAEKVLRFVLYAIGGALMSGAAEWTEFFNSALQILQGALGLGNSAIQLITLGLSGL